ncbi:hypothetical protein BV25DRAFT_1842980 [Artomyces pyxidatus]|uniref:Uncharacterized protein n=1 Tax=Artomyces pyxidatus TaxID=48021 RepID=A0ACB8SHQ8_9AGAM|nr:hypothetical protein BV25DRAFT_1842980 [Artomyces pyxidatus]
MAQSTTPLPRFKILDHSLSLSPPGPPHTLVTDLANPLPPSSTTNDWDTAKQHMHAAQVAASIISPHPQCRPGHCLASTGPPGQWFGLDRNAVRIVEVVHYSGGTRVNHPITLCVQPLKPKDWRPVMWSAYMSDSEVERLADPRSGNAPSILELNLHVRSVVLGNGRDVTLILRAVEKYHDPACEVPRYFQPAHAVQGLGVGDTTNPLGGLNASAAPVSGKDLWTPSVQPDATLVLFIRMSTCTRIVARM